MPVTGYAMLRKELGNRSVETKYTHHTQFWLDTETVDEALIME